MKINLTRNRVAEIDDADAHLSAYKWQSNAYGYAVRMFDRGDGVRRTMFLHHAVMGFPLNKMEVDHIDGNKLNNRRSNLRIVSKRANLLNCHSGRNRRSRYPGVYFHSRCPLKPWQAKIGFNRTSGSLGYFKTQEEASAAYQAAFEEMEKTPCL